VHTVQTSRYHPVTLVERGYDVETQSSVGHMPRQLTILATYRYTASELDNGHDLLQWVMQTTHERHTSLLQTASWTVVGKNYINNRACNRQSMNCTKLLLTRHCEHLQTLVSILQRVIRRDKHPHHVIRTDQPSLSWLRPQRVTKNVSSSRGTLNYLLDVLDVYIDMLHCY
jgi:hypothetical protein